MSWAQVEQHIVDWKPSITPPVVAVVAVVAARLVAGFYYHFKAQSRVCMATLDLADINKLIFGKLCC